MMVFSPFRRALLISNRYHLIPIRSRRFAFPQPQYDVYFKHLPRCYATSAPYSIPQALGQVTTALTGVTVIEPANHGMTGQLFTSSRSIQLILVCVDPTARNMLVFADEENGLAISVLQTGHRFLIFRYFRQRRQGAWPKSEERHCRFVSRLEPQGASRPSRIRSQGTARYGVAYCSDHTIFCGELEEARNAEGEPLLYFRGEYRRRYARPLRTPREIFCWQTFVYVVRNCGRSPAATRPISHPLVADGSSFAHR